MKKLTLSSILPLLFLTFILNSCGISEQTKAAEIVAEEFYENLSDKDYEKAMELVDENLFEITSREDMRKILVQKEEYGKFNGYKKDIGFNMNTTNGVTTVDLSYTCEYEKYTLFEKLTMVKRGNEYKILMYQYNSDKSALTD